MTPAEVAALRAQIYAAGFRPVEIQNPVLGDKLTGKRPRGERWQIEALSDPPPAVSNQPHPQWLNTGIYTGGLRAVDIDIDNPTLARACHDHAVTMLGATLVRRRSDSPRCCLLYRAAVGAPRKLILAGRDGKIEVLGEGNQFVAFGAHYETLAELEWEPHPPGVEMCEDLPAVTEDAVAAFLERCAPIIAANYRQHTNGHDHTPGPADADPLRIAAALVGIPNDGPSDWEAWNRIGMAIWRATGGSAMGREAFNAWSARNAAHDPAAVRERWGHYFTSPPTEIGAGSIFYLGRQARGQPEPQERPPQEAPQAPKSEVATFEATPLDWDEMEAVAPREWVYGHFLIRRFISVLGAPGGTGKTAYAFAVGLAIATGIELLSETVHEPGNVWIYNLEDPKPELLRRLRAATLHHDISRGLLDQRLFVDSGRDRPLCIATALSDGGVVRAPIVDAVIEEIKRRNIRVMIVDPFIRSHSVIENRNDHIDFAAALWGEVADKADCAILLLHHFRKGGISGEADAFRGASALIDAARAALSIAVMTKDEANGFGIEDAHRWQYIRVDNAKLNLAPPPENTTWLCLVGEHIGNAQGGRPDDIVQTVETWEPPSRWDGLSMPTIVRILDRIAAGPGGGEQYAIKRGNHDRWAGTVIVEMSGKTEGQATAILKDWTDSGLLTPTSYQNADSKSRVGVAVNQQKLAEMRRADAPSWSADE